MKRFTVVLAFALVVIVAGAFGWWYLFGHGRASNSASRIPTVAAPCPEKNDLAGIEGWAPGAGKAEEGANNERGNLGGMGSALGGGSASTPTPAPTVQCRELAPQVTQYFKQLQQAKALIPSDTFDSGKRAAELPTDVNGVTSWVRDHIATDIYAGAMRGANGTLQARSGSSADKALLLEALLRSKGVEVRFVHAVLDDDDASRIVTEWKTPNVTPVTSSFDAQAAFTQLGIDQNTAIAQVNAAADAARAHAADVLTRSKTPVTNMLQLLTKANVTIGSPDSARSELENARDHWYLQANVDGAWIDEDPSLHDLQPGTHLGKTPEQPVDALPAAEQHPVTIAIYTDALTNPATQAAVEVTKNMTDLSAEPIRVVVADRSAVMNGKALQTGTFTPSILAADQTASGSAFSPDSVGGSPLADVRLRITVAQPNGAPLIYDRVLLDRRSADGKSIDGSWDARRTATALNLECDGLAIGGDFDPAFVSVRDIEQAQRMGALMAYAVAGGNGTQKPPADAAQAYPIEAMRFFRQDQLARTILTNNGATRFFFDRPMIAFAEHGLRADGDKIAAYTRFDIVENTMAADGTDAARANMQRGFYDTVAEQHVLTQPSRLNTLAIFDQVGSGAGAVRVVQNDPVMGQVAIAPQAPVSIDGEAVTGWWQIDAASGSLVGRVQGGAGQAMSEYVTQLNDASSMWTAISFYADVMRCIAVGVTAPLSGLQGDAAQTAVMDCFANAACSALESIAMGEVYTHADADLQALAYNILDLSFNTHIQGGSKDSWSPWGVACNQIPSNSNNWTWSGSYG